VFNGGSPYTPPDVSSWTWVSQSLNTTVSSSHNLRGEAATTIIFNLGSGQGEGIFHSYPTSSVPTSIIVGFRVQALAINDYNNFGLSIRNSGSGYISEIHIYDDNSSGGSYGGRWNAQVSHYQDIHHVTNPFNSTVYYLPFTNTGTNGAISDSSLIFLGIKDDGTNLTYYVSIDFI
jgi:hypothetical protein